MGVTTDTPQTVKTKLKDGTAVEFRPMSKNDLNRSFDFFKSLPEEDRQYLRFDVSRREFVEQRIRSLDAPGTKRMVAIINDDIVADGALEMDSHEWKKHLGEIRLIVSRAHQRKGLGMLMARELYRLARSESLEQIAVKMMRPQTRARAIFERLGFKEEASLAGYVRDIKGEKQDLIVMCCNVEKLWQELEDYLIDSDWQRVR